MCQMGVESPMDITNDKCHCLGKLEQPCLLLYIQAHKLNYFGHLIRQPHNSIELAVITRLVPGTWGKGRPAMTWIDSINTWTSLRGSALLQAARDRHRWRSIACHPRPTITGDEGLDPDEIYSPASGQFQPISPMLSQWGLLRRSKRRDTATMQSCQHKSPLRIRTPGSIAYGGLLIVAEINSHREIYWVSMGA
jgi:hypothetical protein